MNLYTYTIKRTPRGKYYCVVKIGKDVVYVSRWVHGSGEEAQTEAREHIKRQQQTPEEKTK